jgi:hypothetical protein
VGESALFDVVLENPAARERLDQPVGEQYHGDQRADGEHELDPQAPAPDHRA